MHARTHLTLHPIPDHLAADTAVAMHSTGTTALDVLRQARLYGTDAVLVMTAAEAHAAP
ncbi:hypothetical protein GCM10027290_56000 [Micromonospora sonneratiae]|uniref:Uncharacterized protein n=1 Tax=Micromonospora sonneratiae TaxID=1184706 RepID=A0ABW3YGU7_9ACTN